MSSLARVPGDWPAREFSREVVAAGLNWHVQVAPGPAGAPTLLLLHGTGASTHSFAPLLPLLASQMSVIVPDLPGHGFTTGARLESLTLPRISAALGELLKALKLPPVQRIGGHSAGAALALRMVLNASPGLAPDADIVGFSPSLVAMPAFYMQFMAPLINPVATSSPVTRLIASLAGRIGMIDRLLDSTGSTLAEPQRRPYRQLFAMPEHVRGSVGFMAAADLPALLADSARLAVPCRFVLGERDAWVQGRMLKPVLARHFPKATVRSAPLGHLLHEEDPERAAAELLAP